MSPLPAILSTSEIVSRSASLHFGRIAAVDRSADVAEGAAKPGPELPVVLPATNVLPVRFERGFVAGH